MDIRWLDINDPIVRLAGDIAARANGSDPAAALDPQLLADLATLRGLVAERGEPMSELLSDMAGYVAACVHWARHRHLDAAAGERDLHAAVELFRPVHERLPACVPWTVRSLYEDAADIVDGTIVERGGTLARLGAELLRTVVQERDPVVLNRCLAVLRDAVEATPAGHPFRGSRLTNLCVGLLAQHEMTGSKQASDEALATAREAVAVTGVDSPFRADTLYALGEVLKSRAMVTSDREARDEAIEVLERAAAAMGGEHPKLVDCLQEWGLLLSLRAASAHDSAAMGQAVDIFRRAVAAAGEAVPRSLELLEQLGLTLELWHERTGDRRHAAASIAAFRRAVDLAPVTHPEHARYLCWLAAARRQWYESTQERAAVEEAVSLSQAALAHARSTSHRAAALGELGTALTVRYGASGDVSDLRAAVEALRQATSADPAVAAWLSMLGSALLDLHLATGDPTCLDEAIRSSRAAVAASSPDDPMHSMRQNLLGRMLWHRGDRTADRDALAEAITTLGVAADNAPEDHPVQLSVQTNLGAAFGVLYRHTQSIDALARSVTAFQRVVDRMPDDHVKRGLYLGNLGTARFEKYQVTGEREDREAAIDIMSKAVRHAGPRELPHVLSNLARMLMDQYCETGSISDLDLAASSAERAVTLLPDDHPTRGIALAQLGRAHLARHRHDEDPSELDRALDLLREVAAMPTASVEVRIQAARLCGDEALAAERPHAALAAFTTAVEQLPLLSGRALRQSDQELQLARLSGVACDAAACAIAAGCPDRAVELLEAGRAILHARVLEGRSDLRDLHARAPELARRFAELREELALGDSLVSAPLDGVSREATDQLDRRHELAREWADLVATIRTEHGGVGLFRQPQIDELLPAAVDGPVVIVNISRYRCDVLVLTKDGVQPVHLPELAFVRLVERAVEFMRALNTACGATTAAEREAAEQTIEATIGWLRRTITQPVMDVLDTPVPRLWWSPTSALSFLPLHAAMVDDTVCSYTPTVGALLRARGRSRPEPPGPGLIVALPHTPGHARLPGVTRECDLLTELFPETVVLRGPDAIRADVLRELPAHGWVHLACHGSNDIDRPSRSNVRLWDGPLSVRDLFGLDTERGSLAFLTACETAQGGTLLADEALHIGGAFHLAGYVHVVATLWSVHDATSAELTEAFYRGLSGPAKTGPEPASSAAALHTAVRTLRDRYPNRPSRWAPYLHFGP